jgi:hypothetical protein
LPPGFRGLGFRVHGLRFRVISGGSFVNRLKGLKFISIWKGIESEGFRIDQHLVYFSINDSPLGISKSPWLPCTESIPEVGAWSHSTLLSHHLGLCACGSNSRPSWGRHLRIWDLLLRVWYQCMSCLTAQHHEVREQTLDRLAEVTSAQEAHVDKSAWNARGKSVKIYSETSRFLSFFLKIFCSIVLLVACSPVHA